MRLLITGGCGFLGHHLVEHFLKNTNAEIVIADRMTYASSGLDRLRDIQQLDSKRLLVLGVDLSQPIPEGVSREIGEVDYIIHAAAETHVDNSIVDPLPFIQSNVLGTHHLLWWMRGLKSLKRAFLISTDETYGPASWDSPGNTELDPFRPANPYAAAKAGGECLAFAYANTYKLPLTVVATMNLIGERQGTPNQQEKFVPMVIRRVIQGGKVLIHADPTRTRSGTRFYIHCRNFASALGFMIDQDRALSSMRHLIGNRIVPVDEHPDAQAKVMAANQMPLKIHVAGEREISNLDLAQMIAATVGKPLNYELVDFHSSRPGHDLRYALDGSKIRAMGWKQPLDIDTSLEKTVKWYLAHPTWLGL